MATIKAFRGVRYNPDKISFITRVITPPYDVIGGIEEGKFRNKDPHNFIRLGLGKTPPGGRSDKVYNSVAATFRKWRHEEILIRDNLPSIYVLEQSFTICGRMLKRRGIIAALLLEKPGSGSIYPHENTMGGPKTDRIKLMDACGANLSQPMMMLSDPEGEINSIVKRACAGSDFLYSFRSEDDIGHTVWRIDDREEINTLASAIEPQSAVIADGHHRYESALAFRNSHRPPDTPEGEAVEDYLPSFLVSAKDEGLISLPTHRGVKAGVQLDVESFSSALEDYFSVETLKIADENQVAQSCLEGGEKPPSIGCVMKNGNVLILGLKGDESPPALKFRNKTNDVEMLPVSVLHQYIFPALLGIEPGSADESDRVEYNSSAQEICRGVQSGKFEIGFLLPPTPIDLVQKIARQGGRLPIKSTFFYPKIPSGLVIYPHER